MKIRHGFVSNSSSTSFLAVTTQKFFNDIILPKFSDDEKLFIKCIMTEKVLGSETTMSFSYMSGNNDSISHLQSSCDLMESYLSKTDDEQRLINERIKEMGGYSSSDERDYFWNILDLLEKTITKDKTGQTIHFSIDC